MFIEDFADLLRVLTRVSVERTENEYGELAESPGSVHSFMGYIERRKAYSRDQGDLSTEESQYMLICAPDESMVLRDAIVDGTTIYTIASIDIRYEWSIEHHKEVWLTIAR